MNTLVAGEENLENLNALLKKKEDFKNIVTSDFLKQINRISSLPNQPNGFLRRLVELDNSDQPINQIADQQINHISQAIYHRPATKDEKRIGRKILTTDKSKVALLQEI